MRSNREYLEHVCYEMSVIDSIARGREFDWKEERKRISELNTDILRERILREIDSLRIYVQYLRFEVEAKGREYTAVLEMLEGDGDSSPA
jgi:hypothetical protein